MAFVNAYLTEEEKEKFRTAKVRDPRWKFAGEYLIPSIWTVDRENKIALIDCGFADRDEYWKQTFALIYKQIDNEHLIILTLTTDYFEKEKEKELEIEYNVNLVKRWTILDCTITHTLNITNQKVCDILKDALTVYGVGGNPNRVQSVKAFVEFGICK